MAEPDISPLAKRLAEQNAIDWRTLTGSGPAGRITEGDIFAHLAERHSRAGASGAEAFDEALLVVDDAADIEPGSPAGGDRVAEATLLLGGEPGNGAYTSDQQDDGDMLDWNASGFDDPGEETAASDETFGALAFDTPDANEPGSGETQAWHAGADRPITRWEAGAAEAASFDDLDFSHLDADKPDHEPGDEPGHTRPRAASQPTQTLGPGASETQRPLAEASDAPVSAAFGALPLMRQGLLVRNDVSVAALLEVQAAVERAFGARTESARAALLLRAAARACEPQWQASARLTLAVFGEETWSMPRVEGAASLPFAELLERVNDALTTDALTTDAQQGPVSRQGTTLLVADLSAYGVDEAVLNAGVPSLVLGRLRGEGAAARALLSLSGELEPTRASALLTRVGDLLEAPIGLLL